ncbi:hypothetical protein BDF22DRAFT_740281 [Syncephalis plumigaleata]|nr:hypothetical protein BDF22DRAFT_740281 [Syncephalis plumigaleata]
MLNIPRLVVERIANYADADSLIAFALCSRELWKTISQLHHWWEQCYQEEYSFNDDREAGWMIWYMKTLRVSGLSSPLDKESLHKDKYAMNWFRAFCHRRATDANWFKNDPRQLQDIQMDTPSKHRVAVLQRINFKHETLDGCGIIEQCQPIGGSSSDRFWRLRKPNYTGIGSKIVLKDLVKSYGYCIAVVCKEEGSVSYTAVLGTVLVWPVSRVAVMPPCVLQYECLGQLNIHDNWLLYKCSNSSTIYGKNSNMAGGTTTILMDLATRTYYTHYSYGLRNKTFLQRVTTDTAVILDAHYRSSDHGTKVIHWVLWEYSIHRPEGNPKCLMSGHLDVGRRGGRVPSIKRLDNYRAMIKYDNEYVYDPTGQDNQNNAVALAVVSTRCDKSNRFIDDRSPTWTLDVQTSLARPIYPLDQMVIMTDEGWSIYSLKDGSLLKQISMSTIQPYLDRHCISSYHHHLHMPLAYFRNYLLCPSKDDDGYVAVNLLEPSTTGKLKVSHVIDHYNVKASNSAFIAFLRNMQYQRYVQKTSSSGESQLILEICAANAWLLNYDNKYKILDLSM